MSHWMKYMNPAYIGSYAFEAGEEKILTIESTSVEKIPDQSSGESKEKLVIHFKEPEKPLILNKTNAAAIEKALDTPDVEEWPGNSIILCVQTVSSPHGLIDGVRVRPIRPYMCESCGNAIRNAEGMTYTEYKHYTKKKYGKALCAECAAQAAKKA